MSAKDWLELAIWLAAPFALIIWLMIYMIKDMIKEDKIHAAIMEQNKQSFSERETERDEK